MAVAFALGVFGWFASAIQTYTGAPRLVGVLVLVLCAPVLEPQLVTFALARAFVRRRGAGAWRVTLTGVCVWVGTEWACPKLFADTLGYGVYPSATLRQAADLAGAPGLTAALLVANECALALVRSAAGGRAHARAGPPAAALAGLVAALLAYGTARTHQLAAGAATDLVRAGVVQANISQYDRLAAYVGKFDAVRTILDTHFALSAALLADGRLDVLVWPETVYPTTFGSPKSEAGAAFDREIAAFVARAGVPLVFGSYDLDGAEEFNAAVFLEPPAGGPLTFETYRKAALFPFVERVPALLESGTLRRWLPWLGTWTPGAGARVIPLTLRGGRRLGIAPLICYDVLEPRLALDAARAGAALIVTLSNDSWFAAGPGPRMHLVGAAFRSVESRRPQVRATNTGISAVITATGDLLETAGVDTRATLVAAVAPERRAGSLMLAWGDWLGPVAFAGGVLLLGAPAARRAAHPHAVRHAVDGV